MKIRATQMQQIDVSAIPKGFVFTKNDKIYFHKETGHWVEFPNKNLSEFMFGNVNNTVGIVK